MDFVFALSHRYSPTPLEHWIIFIPILIMIHYTHKITHNFYLRKSVNDHYFFIVSPSVQLSLSHSVCLELCLVTDQITLSENDLCEG